MVLTVIKIIVAALLITFVSWLSGKKTALAGFLTALPVTTLIALAFSHAEYSNHAQTIKYAKSIFVAIPVTLLFFIPFFLAQKFNLSFITCYLSGITLLGIGYFVHNAISKLIM